MSNDNTTKIREVRVNVSYNGNLLNVHRLSIQNSINSIPRVTISVQYPDEQGGAFDLERQVARMANQQARINSFRPSPDLLIQINDGNNGVANFNAYLNQSSTQISGNFIGLNITGLHESSILSMFNPSIYRPIPGFTETSETEQLSGVGFANKMEVGKDATIAERIRELLRVALESNRMQIQEDSNEKVVFENTDEKNKEIAQQVADFLNRSTELTNIVGVEFLEFQHSNNLNSYLENIICSNSSLFTAIVANICPNLLLQFRASITDSDYVLERSRVYFEPQDEIVIPIENLNFNVAGAYSLPLAQILVDSSYDSFKFTSRISTSSISMSANRPLAKFPLQPTIDGRIERVKIPQWLSYEAMRTDSTMGIFQNSLSKYYKTLEDLIEAYEKLSGEKNKLAEKKISFLHFWARLIYYQRFLENATATVKIPLDIKIDPGKTYRVVSHEGVELFTGYLSDILHNIDVNNYNAIANSILKFTHVKTPDFELPQ